MNLGLIKSKGLYNIDNLLLKSKLTSRKLNEVAATAATTTAVAANTSADSNTAKVVPPATTTGTTTATNKAAAERRIPINGSGVGGIATGFLFLFVFICGISAAMSIFVNTKHLKNPLVLGKVEY